MASHSTERRVVSGAAGVGTELTGDSGQTSVFIVPFVDRSHDGKKSWERESLDLSTDEFYDANNTVCTGRLRTSSPTSSLPVERGGATTGTPCFCAASLLAGVGLAASFERPVSQFLFKK
jgi:hypothetical protein